MSSGVPRVWIKLAVGRRIQGFADEGYGLLVNAFHHHRRRHGLWVCLVDVPGPESAVLPGSDHSCGPVQVALIPVFRDFVCLSANSTFRSAGIAHPGFGLPLATYVLFHYFSGNPKECIEAAQIDGASRFGIFQQAILPLDTPAIASSAILQFLWG
jgi:hypothetical protein